MSIITLTTDFGLKDHFVGALKGKILSEYREAIIVDISHDIDLFNIPEASYIIGAAYANFPKGTVHLIGVDAEHTKENRHIAMQWNDHYFICSDNGILSILTQKIVPQKIVEITIHDRFGEEATEMDVFVKVAAHIARGGLLNVVGRDISEIRKINQLQPVVSNDNSTIKGYIVYIDHFGNCVTNITKRLFKDVGRGRDYEITFNNKVIKGIKDGYSDFTVNERFSLKDYEGEKLALFNEAGFLEIAIYRSNPSTVGTARSLLGLKYRDVVNIVFR
ncbi:SAM-dependent chlorinase/fluorinase [Flavobacterium salilacus subsp. salilacus]|uniref:SAM hydrolase/SAM-dependent halogenase family protein n=1 Tax=Flavobacterium TaxID=237 RepID=UPI001074F33B|nr:MULTISPECIES: SAM-dependent chlorinase/fluorinase [Flavobacterium]KAF2516304.1 SAM-dependent chlorinase/fluorinase [Flavobacterium salilacus subsp. salilacus]MBE1613835.1 SAM-dependent chlorinase/fluorinase [Flavobacterium sp. SaA2.13]